MGIPIPGKDSLYIEMGPRFGYNMVQCNHITVMTKLEYKSSFAFTKDTLYLAITGRCECPLFAFYQDDGSFSCYDSMFLA